jgi:hypothetical protein
MPLKQAIYTDFVVSKGEKKNFSAYCSCINLQNKHQNKMQTGINLNNLQ